MTKTTKLKEEDFPKQFGNIDAKIAGLSGEIGRLKHSESRLEDLLRIKSIIEGLKTTPRQDDPGKCGTAYYFVKTITDNNIERAENPSLYRPCSICQTQQPVIMGYEQTFDSPDGDTWEKWAFIMCMSKKCSERIEKVAHFERSYRF
ncbi:MAG: hypothetical protein AABW87_03690 [Nanoarchaeota archaeon]